MKQYLDLLRHIQKNGVIKENRTGIYTKSAFVYSMRFNLSDGFPLLTTKKLHFKSIIHELLWKISGDTNIEYLRKNGVTIWDEWADENGSVGRVYGHQERNFGWRPEEEKDGFKIPEVKGVDQDKWLINEIKNNPNSRRLIVTLWNPHDIDYQKLPPCPCFYQYDVRYGKLNLHVYQRSCDVFLGVPFNIAQEALRLMMMAQVTGYQAGELIWTGADVHIYSNHFEQVDLQLCREPKKLPKMTLNPEVKNFFDFKYEDFVLADYEPHPHIKGDVAV